MMRRMHATTAFLAVLAIPALAPAQDPQGEEKIRKIVEEIAKNMQEIDQMLLRTGSRQAVRSGEAAEAMRRNVKAIEELMRQTQGSQGRVVEQIDQLIEEIQKMAQQSQSQGQPDEQNQQGEPQQGRPRRSDRPDERQQQQQQRERSETPEEVRQRREREGEQPQQQQQPGQQQPQDPTQDPRRRGENTTKGAPREGATGQDPRETTLERWGNLPQYLHFLRGRGGLPEVPEKYRPLLEAYVKEGAKGERGR